MINQSAQLAANRADPRRLLLLGTGYVSFAIGFAGMFLPVLPTTIFWIIAAICFAKKSPAMYRRILAWPGVGPIIGDFLAHGVIGCRSKVIALAGMAAAMALILFIGPGAVLTSAALAGIAFAALYVISRPTSTATSHLTTTRSHGRMGKPIAGGIWDGGSIGHRTAGCGSERLCGTVSYLPGGRLDAQPLSHVGVSAPAEYPPAQLGAQAQYRH